MNEDFKINKENKIVKKFNKILSMLNSNDNEKVRKAVKKILMLFALLGASSFILVYMSQNILLAQIFNVVICVLSFILWFGKEI